MIDASDNISDKLKTDLQKNNVVFYENSEARGLSSNRNLALDLCTTDYIVFIDDDATISASIITQTEHLFEQGVTVLGARLEPPVTVNLNKWFLTLSQHHYLGVHRPDRKASIWGAYMGFNCNFVRCHKLRFKSSLGRIGKRLQSGEDTTFIREVKNHGGSSQILTSLAVIHHVHKDRIKFRYLVRRAYWQGRSEARRKDLVGGLKKELSRNFDLSKFSARGIILGFLYFTCTLVGGLSELCRKS